MLGILNEDSKNNHLISIPRDLLIINSCTSEIEELIQHFKKMNVEIVLKILLLQFQI